MHPLNSNKNPILFFDGVCNLCNQSVVFIIKNDKKKIFRFATIQSEFANKTLTPLGIDTNNPDSVILLYKDRFFQKSDTALITCKLLGFPFSFLWVFWIVPSLIRNPLYNFVAKNRYKWFGKKDACMIPNPELKKRFLE
jgi:predicted DCC family thiol-disulfide oxidoreductase YuxK